MTSDKYASNRPDDDEEDDFGLSPEDNIVLSSDLVDPYEGTEDDSLSSASPDDELNSAADESNDRLSDEILSAQDDGLVKESGLEPEGKKQSKQPEKDVFKFRHPFQRPRYGATRRTRRKPAEFPARGY